ncbi:Rieske (2Fe-2S) protein [Micromonospora carbonacea]|uniref:Cytochrome bc1 complex Rieske iron-sulfur subunit n=1 Tax=Micromonospora carbonacea TaxID=47853 RepID=A0A1C5AHV3_9ACTN|nr:Rieske (2Fe-2S) protein [Micromonospora carbonacea]SCF44795.1 Ferredoxin subunit of nitrite reductase or a ring-hydroxylating dioxygenase [Micromonospora carbonacea]
MTEEHRPCPSRRAVLCATGAAGVTALLAGCQTYGQPVAAPVAADPPGGDAPASGDPVAEPAGSGDPADADAPGEAPDDAPAGGQAAALAAVADLPVGGGRILADRGVVLTRPTQETVKAYSATCTHAGCTVTRVDGGTIVCGCHNSTFDIADGSVRGGPAGSPLPPVAVSVRDGQVLLA